MLYEKHTMVYHYGSSFTWVHQFHPGDRGTGPRGGGGRGVPHRAGLGGALVSIHGMLILYNDM